MTRQEAEALAERIWRERPDMMTVRIGQFPWLHQSPDAWQVQAVHYDKQRGGRIWGRELCSPADWEAWRQELPVRYQQERLL